jgi:hypothetical protein
VSPSRRKAQGFESVFSILMIAGFTPVPIFLGVLLLGTQLGIRVALLWLCCSVAFMVYGCIFVKGGRGDASREDSLIDNARD